MQRSLHFSVIAALLIFALEPTVSAAQDFAMYGVARVGLQGTDHTLAPGFGTLVGFEVGSPIGGPIQRALVYFSFDRHRTELSTTSFRLGGREPTRYTWQTDSTVVVDAIAAGLKYRLADSLKTSAIFGTIGLSLAYEPERRVVMSAGTQRSEWSQSSRWSFGVIAAAGVELMLGNRFGIVFDFRQTFVVHRGEERVAPATFSGNVGLVINVTL